MLATPSLSTSSPPAPPSSAIARIQRAHSSDAAVTATTADLTQQQRQTSAEGSASAASASALPHSASVDSRMGLTALSTEDGSPRSPDASSGSESACASPFPVGLTARERMALRLEASKLAMQRSLSAYDEACKAGKGPREAQVAASEAASRNDLPPPLTPMPTAEQGAPPNDARSIPQLPNAVPAVLSMSTRSISIGAPPHSVAAAAVAGSSSSAAAAPASASSSSSSTSFSSSSSSLPPSCSRTVEEWAVRDEQFMQSMCWGVASAQGERASMEDAHRIVHHFDALIAHLQQQSLGASNLNNAVVPPAVPSAVIAAPPPALPPRLGSQSFFGVYDGHGGREAAEFVEKHLHINVAQRMAQRLNGSLIGGAAGSGSGGGGSGGGASSPNRTAATAATFDLGDAMRLGAADTEAALLADSLEHHSQAGAVIAFTVFSGMQLYVAHAGDSRAVLCRDGRAMDLTQDHKPGLESEQERVAALGGFISDGCVNGEIQVSRALGDVNLSSGRKMLGLSSEVALSKFYLSEEDEFVILACDGLWDVLNSASAVAYARHCLLQHNDIQRCATELVQQALRQHSSDNVSVIVVGFQRELPPSMVGPDGERRVIVAPGPGVPRPVGSHRRPSEKRVAAPPRPQRLQLNDAGRNKLMQALAEAEPTPRPDNEDEEEEQEQEEEENQIQNEKAEPHKEEEGEDSDE